MKHDEIYSAAQLTEFIQEVGFLPLLDSGIQGYSAEEMVADDCRYVVFDDGGWDWPLWKWKGPIVSDGSCVYGKFFNKKAGFISREWWPDFCNYRRSKYPVPVEGTIDDIILTTLREHGSLITRELRAACGFDGPKMRSKFDGYVTRLQMACMDVNTVGDGRYSPLPRHSWDVMDSVVHVPRKSPINKLFPTSELFCQWLPTNNSNG